MQLTALKKINSVFIFLFALFAALYFGASFFIPLTFAAFMAALVVPFCFLLERAGLARILAVSLSTILVFVVVGGISYLLVYQLSIFINDLPQIQAQLRETLDGLQARFSSETGITQRQQEQFFQQRSDEALAMVEDQVRLFLEGLMVLAGNFLLMLVYLFLLLLYRNKFRQVTLVYVSDRKNDRAISIIDKNSKVVHHYLWGRVKVMSILAVMYLLAFWLFNVPYALLLVIFGAIITIIPYIGPFISGLLPIIMFIVFGHSVSEVLVFSSVIIVIQLIESYVLEPLIIGAEVQLSPLAVIVAVIIGGLLWGLSGMILFVPLAAMIKIYADHSPYLRPMGFLLGNETNIDKLHHKN